MEPRSCIHCGQSEDDLSLTKCPMCHRFACEDCLYKRGGKAFCHVGCADEFFFGADEDDEG